MSYELEGTLKEVFETRTFGKGFTKREFVVTVTKGEDDRYPQHIKLTVIKDKVTLLDRFKPGQRLKVTFDLRGSESNGRYYTDLQAWRIDTADGSAAGGGSEERHYEHTDRGGERQERPERGERQERGDRRERGEGRPRRQREFEDEDGDYGGGRHDSMPF